MQVAEVPDACNWIQFGRDCKDSKYKDLKSNDVNRGSDCEVRRAGKTSHPD